MKRKILIVLALCLIASIGSVATAVYVYTNTIITSNAVTVTVTSPTPTPLTTTTTLPTLTLSASLSTTEINATIPVMLFATFGDTHMMGTNVTFSIGSTIIGSTIADHNGVAHFNWFPTEAGKYNIVATAAV